MLFKPNFICGKLSGRGPRAALSSAYSGRALGLGDGGTQGEKFIIQSPSVAARDFCHDQFNLQVFIRKPTTFHSPKTQFSAYHDRDDRGCHGYGEKGTLAHCRWGCNLLQPLWKPVWRFLKKLKLARLPYDPAFSLLGLYQRHLKH